jgi:hypothetical protein
VEAHAEVDDRENYQQEDRKDKRELNHRLASLPFALLIADQSSYKHFRSFRPPPAGPPGFPFRDFRRMR